MTCSEDPWSFVQCRSPLLHIYVMLCSYRPFGSSSVYALLVETGIIWHNVSSFLDALPFASCSHSIKFVGAEVTTLVVSWTFLQKYFYAKLFYTITLTYYLYFVLFNIYFGLFLISCLFWAHNIVSISC